MLLLASASPRRRALLEQIGLKFEVVPAHIDERLHAGESPAAYVSRLALEKARTVQALHPAATVLGADTTVVLDAHILNKPADSDQAALMLRSLAGRTHQVLTGLALLHNRQEFTHVETTWVTFAPIPEKELARYIASGDPLDKAGAYGIQGFAARWIPRIEGDFFNVVGLPLASVVRLLHESGYADV